MQFRVLGPLEVDAGEGPIPLGGPKQRAVLANLLVRANQVVPADTLIDDVWGEEPPEQARNTLQTYVSNLRKTLGDDRVQGRPPGYVLLLEPFELDATRFDSLVRDAKKAMAVDPGVAIATLDDALALWRGPALADLADRPSLLAEAARLDELRLEAQEDRIEGLIAGGDDARAIGELETLVAQLPLRESLWVLLMLALYRDGRQADALNAFQRAREILADQLGIDPSAELARLHERILRQDPGLDLKGEPLRGYRLLEKLGDGADGVVFRAIQPHIGRDVAVKVFREAVATDEVFVRRFDPDSRAAAALEHPHIVPTYDAWREPGRAYVVSRYLRGGSLRSLDARGDVLSPGRAARVVEETAAALAFAHRQGVTHGNVCGSNVLFDAEGNVYLGDFLLRSATVAREEDDVRALAKLTRGLLGARMPERLAGLVSRAETGMHVPDAGQFVDAVREMLEPSLAASESRSDARNPYKGLRAFNEADSGDFFGRTTLVERLVARLSQPQPGARFLAVVGPSGGGKSSVVRAGLVPAIRRGALEGSVECFVAEMFPGPHPIEELEAALLRIAVRPASRLRDTLEVGSRGLVEAVDLVVPGDAEVVLVVDQFEELFTLTANERDRELFLESIRVACVEPQSRIRVVATMRADFYDRPLIYPRFGELLAARTEAVPPLTPDELEQAIRRPAERSGARPEPGLEAAMVADVTHQPGALPLLQYALTELFERRTDEQLTLASYREIGGVAGALSARAERLFREADPSWQRTVRQVFLRLVTLGEGSPDTRRRVARGELDALDVEPGSIDEVLETFGRHRLLTFDREPSTREPTVEIAHEALLGAWVRLDRWIDEAREDLRQERGLERASAEWQGSGRDASFLLRGARLEQVESWTEHTDLAIGKPQREYVKASIDRRDLDRATEEERLDHGARMERRSRTRLRALVAVFAVAALVAATLTIVATEENQAAARAARISTARELAAAAVATLDTDPERSILLAAQAIARTRSVDGSVLSEAEDALHRAVGASRTVMTVTGIGGSVDWAPSGLFVAEGAEGSGVIEIRDAATGDRVRRWVAHDGDITGVAFSPDGSLLASTGSDGSLCVWAVATGERIAWSSARGQANGPSFSSDGTRAAAAWSGAGIVRIVDLSHGGRVRTFGRLSGATGTSFSPDGRRIAVSGHVAEDAAAVILDVATGEQILHFAWPMEPLGVSWSPDGRYLAVAGDFRAPIWNARTGELVSELIGHIGLTESVDWSPDSSRLVTGSNDGTVRVWDVDLATGPRELLRLSALETRIDTFQAVFSPDGNSVLAGDGGPVYAGPGNTIAKVWDVGRAGDAEWSTMEVAGSYPGDAVFLPDGQGLVLNPNDRSLEIWTLETGRQDRRTLSFDLGGPRTYIWRLDVSADGEMIAVTSGSWVGAYDVATGDRRFAVSDAIDAAWHPDGEHLVVADADGAIRVVDRTGETIRTLRTAGSEIWGLDFSADGRLLATTEPHPSDPSEHPAVRIWDWSRGEVITTIDTETETVSFDPDGSRIVTAPREGFPIVWDTGSGRQIAELSGHTGGAIFDPVFSPDGSSVATGSSDGSVRLLDPVSGVEQLVLRGHDLVVTRVAFSPDGTKLASVSVDGTVRVWALDLDDLLEIADAETTRSLTDAECRQYLHVDGCWA